MFKYWPVIRNSTVFKLAVTAAVSFILYEMAAFMLPILLAVGLAFALYPLVNIITKIKVSRGTMHINRVVAIIFAIIGFCVFVGIAVGLILLPLFGQINDLMVRMPDLAVKVQSGSFEDMLGGRNGVSPRLPSDFGMLLDYAVNWAMAFVGGVLRHLLLSSIDIVRNLVGLIIVPFLTFYFLKDWRELRAMLINLFNYDSQAKAAHVVDEIGVTLSSYVNGLGKCALLSGFCITVGTLALGIDFPLVLGFWAILAETIPVVGPMMGAVPAVFIAYGQSSGAALDVALFYLIYYQLDANFIMPKIMGQKIDLHPVILILSLLIGAKLFGILGMVFAVPVAAVYRVLYKELWHAGEGQAEKAGKIL